MVWKWIRRLVKWIYGVLKDKPLDPDCPTCGPDLGFSPCGPDEPDCATVNAAADILRARYEFIYTNNQFKRKLKAPPQDCDPINKTARLIKTDNRCQFAGEVRHYRGSTMVCLQCSDCSGQQTENRTDADGRIIPIPSSTCISGNCGGGGGAVSSSNTISYSDIPNGKCMIDGSCPQISCGYWYYVNFGRKVTPLSTMTIKGRERRNRNGANTIDPRSSAPPPPGGGDNDTVPSNCQPELIYDITGCKVIGIKPVLLARGKLAYHESTDLYPETLKCDGETKIYGDDAGTPIRDFKMPNRALESHFYSFQNGVVSHLDPGNSELNNTYVRFIQLELRNVKLPPNPPKPWNTATPLTVMMAPRTDAQKSVRSSGLFYNNFRTNIHGELFAVPKNGVNGPEYFDKNTYYGGSDTHRGGENMPEFSMTFDGPDTQFDRPALDADTIKFELNIFGKGMQYEWCASGVVPDSKFVGRENQKGTRSSVNLNHFVKAKDTGSGAVNKCIKAIAYADANRVIDKGDFFTYPLLNLFRNGTVYLEAFGPPYRLRHTKNTGMPNNGHPGRPLAWDGTSDFSWLGDTLWHEKPIHDASCYYGNLKTYIPNQYGGLINAVYHDLQPLKWEDIESGTVTIDRGDSYINQHYIIRKSFVSDKIMQDISPNLPGGGLGNNGLFGRMLRNLFNNVGLEECGTCPENADFSDPRNGGQGAVHQALRYSDPDGAWDGTGQPPPATGLDIYFPNVQKTQIIFPVESDVNLYYRQTGDLEAGEFYYRKLKGRNLDSSFPLDSDWKLGLLNRTYVESKENAKWKMIFRVIINLIFTYGLGILLIVLGFVTIIRALSQATAGLTFNVGFVPAMAMGAIVVVVGFFWIRFWANSDSDNRFWDNLLGIDGCWPDIVAPPSVTLGSRYRIKDGRLKQFEDNYWAYNWDYSKQNEIAITLGLPDPYSTCVCPLETTYEILYSNMQNTNSMTDAYRNFKVNSYLEIPSYSGKLKKIFRLSNRVYVQTSDAMFSLQSGNNELKTGDDGSAYLGSSGLFLKPVEIFGGLKEGRGGTNDPNACEVTKWGYINIDVEARQIGLFTGDSYTLLGDSGMSKFLDKYMPFEAPEGTLRDEKSPNGIGYSLGVDNARSLLFITKKDFVLKNGTKKDRSWTLTFDMDNMAWVGFEFFTPLLYTWDRFKMYSMNEGTMWMHNAEGKFSTVYGKRVPMVVDYVVIEKDFRDAFKFNNSTIHLDVDSWTDLGFVPRKDTFFDKIGVYNTFQSSGLMPVVHQNKREQPEATSQDPTKLPVSYLHRSWRYSAVIDKVDTQGMPLFTSWKNDFFTDFNIEPIKSGKQMSDSFIDNYMVVRLVFDNPDDKIRVLLKRVVTAVNLEIL